MNREEYLQELQKYLKRLPADDYKNAMEYFTEYFEESGPEGEAQVIAELGTPKEAASELLSALLDEKTSNALSEISSKSSQSRENGRYRKGDPIPQSSSKTSPLSIFLIVCLAVLAAPIGAPLAIVVLALIFVMAIVLACGVLCIFLFSISGVLVGLKILISGITALPVSFSGSFLMAGCGLLSIGLGILFFVISIYLCKWIGLGIVRFTQWILHKGKEKRK